MIFSSIATGFSFPDDFSRVESHNKPYLLWEKNEQKIFLGQLQVVEFHDDGENKRERKITKNKLFFLCVKR